MLDLVKKRATEKHDNRKVIEYLEQKLRASAGRRSPCSSNVLQDLCTNCLTKCAPKADEQSSCSFHPKCFVLHRAAVLRKSLEPSPTNQRRKSVSAYPCKKQSQRTLFYYLPQLRQACRVSLLLRHTHTRQTPPSSTSWLPLLHQMLHCRQALAHSRVPHVSPLRIVFQFERCHLWIKAFRS